MNAPPVPAPSLALVVIARNEARCITRCLRSAQPWVDEMWVIDTGSTDATPQLAAACGARVAHFAWVDDFAAARNFALAQTQADWRLVLDADEWLQAGAERLRAHLLPLSASAAGYVGQVEVASEFEDAGALRCASSRISRLLPRGVGYVGRVHEQVQHALPVQRLPLVIGHDGYRQAMQAAKRGRNLALLQAALREHPGQPYLLYQLGKEAEVGERYADAVPPYLQAYEQLRCKGHGAGAGQAPDRRPPAWLHDLVVRLIFCLKRLGRHEQAVALADAELPHWSHSPDFHFALGDLLLDWAACQPGRAGELLPMIEAAWRRCLEIGEAPGLEGAVQGRGSWLAAHNLALLQQHLGSGTPQARARP